MNRLTKETAKIIFRDAIELISNANRWTTYAEAMDKDGRHVSYNTPEACRWSVEGALLLACSKSLGGQEVETSDEYYDILTLAAGTSTAQRLQDRAGYPTHDLPGLVNDWSGHADVMRMLDEARGVCDIKVWE